MIGDQGGVNAERSEGKGGWIDCEAFFISSSIDIPLDDDFSFSAAAAASC
jgi:hypothetical protein